LFLAFLKMGEGVIALRLRAVDDPAIRRGILPAVDDGAPTALRMLTVIAKIRCKAIMPPQDLTEADAGQAEQAILGIGDLLTTIGAEDEGTGGHGKSSGFS
jgi:hypothetical protein